MNVSSGVVEANAGCAYSGAEDVVNEAAAVPDSTINLSLSRTNATSVVGSAANRPSRAAARGRRLGDRSASPLATELTTDPVSDQVETCFTCGLSDRPDLQRPQYERSLGCRRIRFINWRFQQRRSFGLMLSVGYED